MRKVLESVAVAAAGCYIAVSGGLLGTAAVVAAALVNNIWIKSTTQK